MVLVRHRTLLELRECTPAALEAYATSATDFPARDWNLFAEYVRAKGVDVASLPERRRRAVA